MQSHPLTSYCVKVRTYELPDGGLERALPDQDDRYRDRHAFVRDDVSLHASGPHTLVVTQWQEGRSDEHPYFAPLPEEIRRRLQESGAARRELLPRYAHVRTFSLSRRGTTLDEGDAPGLGLLVERALAVDPCLHKTRNAITSYAERVAEGIRHAFDRHSGPPGAPAYRPVP